LNDSNESATIFGSNFRSKEISIRRSIQFAIVILVLCAVAGASPRASAVLPANELRPNGARGLLAELQKEITANDGAAGDSFGYAISLDGRTAIIGAPAPAATVNGNTAQGAAYMFRLEGRVWTEVQKLTASDGAAFDNFGNCVALHGSTVIVGAPDAAINGNAA
jgi:hypothetical protein